jgi:hypothetical protein
MSFVIQNHDGKRSVPPLQPEPDDAQTSFECMKDLGLFFWDIKELSNPRSSLYAVCTKCDELIDKHTSLGESKAQYHYHAQNLYFKLLEYFLPEYDKMSAYNAEIQERMEVAYETFQNWNYIMVFDNQMRPAENNRPPQMRETGVSDMRNLLARLQNT